MARVPGVPSCHRAAVAVAARVPSCHRAAIAGTMGRQRPALALLAETAIEQFPERPLLLLLLLPLLLLRCLLLLAAVVA